MPVTDLSEVVGLSAILADKVDTSNLGAAVSDALAGAGVATLADITWANVSGKPSAFTPANHNHAISDVTGLQTALEGKQPSGAYLTANQSITFSGDVSGSGSTSVSLTLATVNSNTGTYGGTATSAQISVDGKGRVTSVAAVPIAAPWADISGKPAVLTNTTASFTTAQETKLAGIATGATANSSDATLLARANHTGTQAAATISDFAEAVDDRVAQLLTQGSNVTLSYNDGANTLTVSASGGGSDPWTYVKLSSDFTTTSATAVDITGLAFTPAANTQYEFEAHLLTRTATATVGPRPGVAWPTGGTDGVCSIYIPSAAGSEVQQHGNIAAAVLAPVGGLPTTTGSWGTKIQGAFIAGASPSGTVKLQLASETAGTTVTARAGSFLKYRTI
jgi:hypothetical protein